MTNLFVVVIALLIGVIAGMVALQLARASEKLWPAALCYGFGVFAGTVLFVLTVADHLTSG